MWLCWSGGGAVAGSKTKSADSLRRKIDPKLRMVMNGDFAVNAVRAEFCGGICVRAAKSIKGRPVLRREGVQPLTAETVLEKPQVKTLRAVTNEIVANVFVLLEDGENNTGKLKGETARRGNVATLEVPLDQIDAVADMDGIAFVGLGEQLRVPDPVDVASAAPGPGSQRNVGRRNKHGDGQGVLIGLIDVGGFDFAHPDFLDDRGNSRFVSIWDQGGSFRPSPRKQSGSPFDYGSEFHAEHLNAALKAARRVGVAASDLEPQSQMTVGSHATHVASIAGGNAGIAPQASLAAVLLDLPEEDLDRRLSLFDSARLAHAVEYLCDLGQELEMPVSINISLGTNGHAHDGSSAVSRWIDSALTVPGRCVCVAGGNAGQEKPAGEGDFGFISGRIHTSDLIPARGLSQDIEWFVVGNGIADLSENELEIWYEPQDRFAVSVKPPGLDWIGPVGPREFMENQQLKDLTFLSVYNELYHPANGANRISVYLSPFFGASELIGVRAGQWTLRLHGLDIRDGRYHGWIERDDPRKLGNLGDQEAWSFPSFLTEASNVDNSSISSLASGNLVITVANLDRASETINISSSQGPTRDGRHKPEVAAPGTAIIAAKGFADDDQPWTSKTGTSMASPHVCGVVALMLAVNPQLTAAQIGGIIKRTARPLPGMDYDWRDDAGFGVIDPEACLDEAAVMNLREDRTT